MRAWVALALALCAVGCKDEKIEDVPQDVCVSGKRWVGGRRGSEEMYPGRDCVQCHLDNDGPQLIAGGTVYGFGQGREGASVVPTLGQPQSVDCFGIEGVKVTVIGADSEELTTVTNRAGNFFFEGRPDELVKPILKARIDYETPDGAPVRREMSTMPAWGGCARCHSPYTEPTENFNLMPTPDAVIGAATDYIDLNLPVAEFLDDTTAYASSADDAAHAASVSEIHDFVTDSSEP
jgi:hypothetical protein